MRSGPRASRSVLGHRCGCPSIFQCNRRSLGTAGLPRPRSAGRGQAEAGTCTPHGAGPGCRAPRLTPLTRPRGNVSSRNQDFPRRRFRWLLDRPVPGRAVPPARSAGHSPSAEFVHRPAFKAAAQWADTVRRPCPTSRVRVRMASLEGAHEVSCGHRPRAGARSAAPPRYLSASCAPWMENAAPPRAQSTPRVDGKPGPKGTGSAPSS